MRASSFDQDAGGSSLFLGAAGRAEGRWASTQPLCYGEVEVHRPSARPVKHTAGGAYTRQGKINLGAGLFFLAEGGARIVATAYTEIFKAKGFHLGDLEDVAAVEDDTLGH